MRFSSLRLASSALLSTVLACAVMSLSHTTAAQLELRDVDKATVRILSTGDIRAAHTYSGPAFQMSGGHGSGLVISNDCLIVTAAHVIADMTASVVYFPGEQTPHPARVVARTEKSDVAIIQCDVTPPHFMTIPEKPPKLTVGDAVSASGYPMDATELYPAAVFGNISRLSKEGKLQLAISVNPGNSGGPLIDQHGNLVGILFARGAVESGVQGIGFAEPLATVLRIRDVVVAHLKKKPAKDEDYDSGRALVGLFSQAALEKDKFEPEVKYDEDLPPAGRAFMAITAWNRGIRTLAQQRLRIHDVDRLPPELATRTRSDFAYALRVASTLRNESPKVYAQFRLNVIERASRESGDMAQMGPHAGSRPNGPAQPAEKKPGWKRRFRIRYLLSAALDSGPNFGFGGHLALGYDVVATQYFSAFVRVGADAGAWRSELYWLITPELGIRGALGSHHQIFGELGWGLPFIQAEKRQTFPAWVNYRISLGYQNTGFFAGISWREVGRQANDTFRTFQIFLGSRF